MQRCFQSKYLGSNSAEGLHFSAFHLAMACLSGGPDIHFHAIVSEGGLRCWPWVLYALQNERYCRTSALYVRRVEGAIPSSCRSDSSLVSAILLSQEWVWALGLPLELADGTCGTEGGTEHQQLNYPPLECGLLVWFISSVKLCPVKNSVRMSRISSVFFEVPVWQMSTTAWLSQWTRSLFRCQ